MLLVDDRENPKVVNKLLMRMGNDNVKVCRMIQGDYVMGDWGIEAKEINDLYRSILGIGRNRTIVAQLQDLQDNFENPVLVVYGIKLKPWVAGGRPTSKQIAMEMARMKKVMQHFKMTFYQRFPKIRYMELYTMDEFVEWLVVNHTQLGIAISNHEPELQSAAKNANLDSRIQILSSIKGVSPQMAEDLLLKFGSIPKLLRVSTTQKSLMDIKGVGRQRAKDILALRETYESVEN
jgi:ERCC4-type nuclease